MKLKKTVKLDLDSFLDFSFLIYIGLYLGNRLGTDSIDGYLVRISFFIYLGFFLLNIIAKSTHKQQGFYQVQRVPMNFGMFCWFAVFICFSLISSFWSIIPENVFVFNNSFIQILFLTIAIPYRLRTQEDIYKYLKYIYIGNVYSVIVLLIKVPFSTWGEKGRLDNIIGWNCNDLGLHLTIAILISFLLIIKKYDKFKLFNLYILFDIGFLIVIFQTGSRQSLLLLILGVLLFVASFSKNAPKKILNIFLVLILMVVLFVIIMNNDSLYRIIGYRFEGMISFLTNNGSGDVSSRERFALIHKAREVFIDNPIGGIGMNNFAVFAKNNGFRAALWAHNNYLELLSGVGIIGTVLYYWFVFVLEIKLFIRLKSKDRIIQFLFIITTVLLCEDYVGVNYVYLVGYVFYAFAYKYLIIFDNKNGKISKKY